MNTWMTDLFQQLRILPICRKISNELKLAIFLNKIRPYYNYSLHCFFVQGNPNYSNYCYNCEM